MDESHEFCVWVVSHVYALFLSTLKKRFELCNIGGQEVGGWRFERSGGFGLLVRDGKL